MTQKTTWKIDTEHSEAQFKVKHLMIASLSGTFKHFSGTVESEQDDFHGSKISFEIDANSVDTYHDIRDGVLRSSEFLDSENYPKIFFTGVLQKKANQYLLNGELTLRGITKTIQLDAELTGTGLGFRGDQRAGFEVSGKIDRKDFGIHFGLLTEAGILVVGEEVKLHFDIELIKTNV